MTLPGEKEVTHSSQWGLRTVVKVNEADGSVLEKSKEAPLRNKDGIVKCKHLCDLKTDNWHNYCYNIMEQKFSYYYYLKSCVNVQTHNLFYAP